MLTAYKARILQYVIFLLLLRPQVGKSIDDDAKNKIKNNDDQNEEEQQVVNHSTNERKSFLRNEKQSLKMKHTKTTTKHEQISVQSMNTFGKVNIITDGAGC